MSRAARRRSRRRRRHSRRTSRAGRAPLPAPPPAPRRRRRRRLGSVEGRSARAAVKRASARPVDRSAAAGRAVALLLRRPPRHPTALLDSLLATLTTTHRGDGVVQCRALLRPLRRLPSVPRAATAAAPAAAGRGVVLVKGDVHRAGAGEDDVEGIALVALSHDDLVLLEGDELHHLAEQLDLHRLLHLGVLEANLLRQPRRYTSSSTVRSAGFFARIWRYTPFRVSLARSPSLRRRRRRGAAR